MVFNYLEELYVRQLVDNVVEGDDFIAYYCKVKKEHEKITIATSDRDMCQLITDDVRIYMLDLKTYVTKDNFNTYFKYHLDNAALMKILCGDNSDSIKGVRRLGEGTLLKHFPELTERKVELDEIIEGAIKLQGERISNKQKPLQILTNISESITDGIQGSDLFEINRKLVDLTVPLLTEGAIEEINNLIDSPMSDDRSIKKVYAMLKEDGIDKMLGEHRFTEYLLPFKKLIEREKKNNILN
jgi:5'-3' exonuclease